MDRSVVLRGVALAVLAGVWVALAVMPALAADNKKFTVTKGGAANAQDLHVTFAWTGGDIRVVGAVTVAPDAPPVCGAPAVKDSDNPPPGPNTTNTVELDWGAACVNPGDTVEFEVNTAHGPLAVAAVNWTGVAGAPGGIEAAGPGSYSLTDPDAVPALGPWPLLAAGVLLAALAGRLRSLGAWRGERS
ncbi:MAG TPA: hypothetical protein VNV66_10175 [Pilimelia sp.]|nr:hypothetical protein [Pilimelia sp.]